MTVSTTENNQQYTGDGVLTVYAVTYKVLDESHIEVYLDGIIQPSGFTVTLNPDQETTPGADITFGVAPGVGVIVNIVRTVPLTQLTDYQPFDAFPAETHELALDNLTFQVQQLDELIRRSPVPPPSSQPGDILVDGNLTVQGDTSLKDTIIDGELTVGEVADTHDINVIGSVTATENVSAGLQPTQDDHLTRKDYVDLRSFLQPIKRQQLTGLKQSTSTINVGLTQPGVGDGTPVFSGSQLITPTQIGSTIVCELHAPIVTVNNANIVPAISLNIVGESNSRAVFTPGVNGSSLVGGAEYCRFEIVTANLNPIEIEWRFGPNQSGTMYLGGGTAGAFWGGTVETYATYTETL